MLDQNTDRMWYVIGAVIVGAALIFLVNSSFPQLFASVGDTFKDKTEEVSYVIDDISPGGSSLYANIKPVASIDLKREKNGFYITSTGEKFGGLSLSRKLFTSGTRYQLSYDFQKESGIVDRMGGHLVVGSNVKAYVDGVHVSNHWTDGFNNTFPNDTSSHHVMVEFTYDVENLKDVVDKDSNVYIQPNRSGISSSNTFIPYEPYTGWIRNITLEKVGI